MALLLNNLDFAAKRSKISKRNPFLQKKGNFNLTYSVHFIFKLQ